MSMLSAGSHGVQKRLVPGSLELELEVVMNYPMCALATELGSFEEQCWLLSHLPRLLGYLS